MRYQNWSNYSIDWYASKMKWKIKLKHSSLHVYKLSNILHLYSSKSKMFGIVLIFNSIWIFFFDTANDDGNQRKSLESIANRKLTEITLRRSACKVSLNIFLINVDFSSWFHLFLRLLWFAVSLCYTN